MAVLPAAAVVLFGAQVAGGVAAEAQGLRPVGLLAARLRLLPQRQRGTPYFQRSRLVVVFGAAVGGLFGGQAAQRVIAQTGVERLRRVAVLRQRVLGYGADLSQRVVTVLPAAAGKVALGQQAVAGVVVKLPALVVGVDQRGETAEAVVLNLNFIRYW
ncbi:hypothetical protein [Serratia rhizosphaerae]|uniref:hypothetical protein n=1 Tax=Serratia rhizosphaerae TaxID=2597702 RepID=UPI001FE77D3F|nr:hypothetical protein [Serratia rhizosphaerae]